MSGTSSAPPSSRRPRALGALTTALAVVVTGLALSTGAASAAPGTITGATFEWTVNSRGAVGAADRRVQLPLGRRVGRNGGRRTPRPRATSRS